MHENLTRFIEEITKHGKKLIKEEKKCTALVIKYKKIQLRKVAIYMALRSYPTGIVITIHIR